MPLPTAGSMRVATKVTASCVKGKSKDDRTHEIGMYAVNLFRFSLVLLLALSPSVVLAQAAPEQLQAAELAKLAGDWTVVSDFVNGQPDDTRVGAIVKIIGDELVRTSPGASNRVARLSVDPSLTPKGIDIHWTAGRFQGET